MIRKSFRSLCVFGFTLGAVVALFGCAVGGNGGSSGSSTPPSLTVTITSPATTSVNVGVNENVAFTASVSGDCTGLGCGVTWTVNGIPGGNSTFGTIGLSTSTNYQSPATIPSPATFQITATSVANSLDTASVTVTITGPPVAVSITSPLNLTQELAVNGSLPITASVTGAANTAVNWTVNGVTNGNSTFGTISGSGLSVTYNAPAAVPSPATFNVTATSAADSTKSASVSVTILSGVVVSIIKPSSPLTLQAGSAVSFLASVTGTANTGVNWSVNGIANGNSTYGTISGLGLSVTYEAPFSVPTPATFNVTAISLADGTKTASVNVTIASAVAACGSGNESVLNGQYAFNLIGFNSSGFNAVVGSISADGSGHITGGEADQNGINGVHSTSAVSGGLYSVGSDNRGCATIVTNFGTYTTRFQLGGVSSGVATTGHLMESDAATSSAFIATGELFLQVTANFAAGLNGGYVHYLEGWDSASNGRIVCGGVHTSSSGNNSNSEETCNDNGTVTHTGPVTGNVGTYSSIDGNGRFTESVGSNDLVGYMVYSGGIGGIPTALTLTTNAAPVLAGQAIQQTGTFGQNSLDGVYAIYSNGVNNTTSGKIFFGLYTANGSGSLTQNAYYENDGGTWVSGSAQTSYFYSVDSYGDTTLSTNTISDAGHLYLVGTGWAVFIDVDGGSFGGFGALQPDNGSLGNAALNGSFFGGTTAVINQAAEADGTIAGLNGAPGALSTTTDVSSITDQLAAQLSSSTVSINSNGTYTTNAQPGQIIGLVINSSYFLFADHTGSPYPTILLFGPGQIP